MKEKENKVATCCFVYVSMCFFVSAAFGFFNGNSGMAAMQLCLGSVFLCLSSNFANKDKDIKENEMDNEDDNK